MVSVTHPVMPMSGVDAAELLLDHQLFEDVGPAAPRFGPVRHQIAGVDEEVALLLGRQGPQLGDGFAGLLAVPLGFGGQRERRAVRLAAALRLDDVEQRVGAVAHQRGQRARPAQIQVRVVFPREPDTAVQLNVVLRVEDLGPDGVRCGDRTGEPGAVQVVGARRVPGGRGGLFGVDEHVGGMVLDRLEGADGPAELLTDLGVLDRHLQARPTDADRLGRRQDPEHRARPARGTAQHTVLGERHPAQRDGTDAAGGVQRLAAR